MRTASARARVDLKQSDFGLAVLELSVGVPGLGMMNINPKKGQIWFFQAFWKIRL
jgi:hypothetical protein